MWLRCYAEAWLWRWLPLNRALAHISHKPELVFCYGISVQ
ncbi:acetyltransferase [Vibrio cholerae]|nr:acetyltransferase [Vibrio cholerae]